MECSSCYELYNEKERIPKNLPCGHTNCEMCLEKIYSLKGYMECPMCRVKISPDKKPKNLSKNFVVLELAVSHQKLLEKVQLCPSHNEPFKFYCESDQIELCVECMADHSGHKFIKIAHSVSVLNLNAENLISKIEKKGQDVKDFVIFSENAKEMIMNSRDENINLIENEFREITKALQIRKDGLLAKVAEICDLQIENIETNLAKLISIQDTIEKDKGDAKGIIQELQDKKYVKDDAVPEKLRGLDEKIEELTRTSLDIYKHVPPECPNVIINTEIIANIKELGKVSQGLKNARICFFGEKDKILEYRIANDDWRMATLPNANFNYYSSAVTLPPGEVLLIGGGNSSSCRKFTFTELGIKYTTLPNLKQCRKEHASVLLGNEVYVMGGYDGISKFFLNTCEKLDLSTLTWAEAPSMNIRKCAFAVCSMGTNDVFTFGGYDGESRIAEIERFSKKDQKWTVLEVSLLKPLSNAACVNTHEDHILVLGGGTDLGFSYEVYDFNMKDKSHKILATMPNGRDLRNKIISLMGCIYAIGGSKCAGEKLNLRTVNWSPIKSYIPITNDNLDSWSCALVFDMLPSNPIRESQFIHNYGDYSYHPTEIDPRLVGMEIENDDFSEEFSDGVFFE